MSSSSQLSKKYRPFPPVDLPDRQWPGRVITHAPVWCSVDLRDGNQALPEPMGVERKRRMFDTLVKMGFKQIEVGFPSASQTEFDFLRMLVDDGMIPDDVTVQVLIQAREELIRRTFEALDGVRQAIVHVYNSTSTLQRRVVFRRDRRGITDIAVAGVNLVRELAKETDTKVLLEYSPESFTGTELEFARDICSAVMDAWQPKSGEKMIFNLPATVEMATPNVYADQIEWFARNMPNRDSYLLSVHPHNDRGTAVAAAELGLMAGADRVEGTLFGNGERTGNVDVVTLALNMMTQGVDPELEIGNVQDLVDVAEYCNRLPVHHRHPYAGELVFTAFSGSHQDAIKKGLAVRESESADPWEVPYLPIDPDDIGRTYEAVIRINSQSGKGGVAYIMEQDFGLRLPRQLQVEFSRVVQEITDQSETELLPKDIWAAFEREYLSDDRCCTASDRIDLGTAEDGRRRVAATVSVDGVDSAVDGLGNGPIDAFVDGLQKVLGESVEVLDYSEHSVGSGASARAVAYVSVGYRGRTSYGVARHESILTASVQAVLSAVSRIRRKAAPKAEQPIAPAAQ